MVADALKGDRIIGMVLLRPGYEADYERSPSIFPFGCAGVITDVEALPNGEYNIVLQAFAKFRITREEASRPYRIANVTVIPELLGDQDKTILHTQRLRLEALLAGASGHVGLGSIPPGISDEQFVNGVAQFVEIDPLDREKLLEREGVLSRASTLVEILDKILSTPR
jgi:Lon protease-like protein